MKMRQGVVRVKSSTVFNYESVNSKASLIQPPIQAYPGLSRPYPGHQAYPTPYPGLIQPPIQGPPVTLS